MNSNKIMIYLIREEINVKFIENITNIKIVAVYFHRWIIFVRDKEPVTCNSLKISNFFLRGAERENEGQ